MPWSDDGEPVPQRPARPEPEPVAFIRGRGIQAFIVIVGAVVVVAGSLAVARIGGDAGSTDIRAAGDQTTTARRSGSAAPTSLPPSTPPSSVPPALPQTTLPGDGTGAQPGGTPAPGDGTPPATAAPRAETCAPAEVGVMAAPDSPTYERGQDVIVTATARNNSARPCDPRDPGVEIRDGTGAVTVRLGATDFTDPPVNWPPGGDLTKAFTWNRTVCTTDGCQRATPGLYTATAIFGEYRSGPVNFEIL